MNEWKNNPQNLMTAAGCLVGILLAAGVMVLVWLNESRSEVLQGVTNFLSSLPLLIAYKLGVPKNAAVLVFFLYWGTVGASFGWLSKQRPLLRREITALLAVTLAALHWAADVRLTAGIEAAAQAFVEALKQTGK